MYYVYVSIKSGGFIDYKTKIEKYKTLQVFLIFKNEVILI